MTERQLKQALKLAKSKGYEVNARGKKLLKRIKIPRCNGQPQLWFRGYDCSESVRIIYPDGAVEYSGRWHGEFYHGCTSTSNQLRSILNCIVYDLDVDKWLGTKPQFVDYL